MKTGRVRGSVMAWLLAAGLALVLAGPVKAGPGWGRLHLQDLQLGLSAGFGLGTDIFGSGVTDGHESRHLLALPHLQFGLHDPYGAGRWWAGRFDIRTEATLIGAFEPGRGLSYGVGLFVRHHWLGVRGVVPYLQAGAGFLDLDVNLVDQSNGLAFQPQGGVGLQWRVRPRLLVDTGLRFVHISNADTHGRNFGIETFQFLVGFSWGVAGPTIQGDAAELAFRARPRASGGLD